MINKNYLKTNHILDIFLNWKKTMHETYQKKKSRCQHIRLQKVLGVKQFQLV